MFKVWRWINAVRRPLQIIRRVEAEEVQGIEFEPDQDQRARLAKILVGVLSLTVGAGIVSSTAVRLDVSVSARGRIDSVSSGQAMRARQSGRVSAVLVKDGESVVAGQTLIQLDKNDVLNQLSSLRQQQSPLLAQVAILQAATAGQSINFQDPRLSAIPEIATSVRQLNLIHAQLSGSPNSLSPEQMPIFNLFVQRVSAINANQQAQVQQSQSAGAGAIAQIDNQNAQLRIELEQLDKIKTLFNEGGIPRNTVLQQVGAANKIQSEIVQSQIQRSQLMGQQQQALIGSQQQVEEIYRQLLGDRASLITQLASRQREAQDRLVQLNSQIKQAEVNLANDDVKAPTSGTVTGLTVTLPNVSIQAGQPLLEVTPDESLIAKVEVNPSDIANLKVGTPVEIQIDAFPKTEFGAIKGSIATIGSNTTTTQNGQALFPVQVRLDKAFLEHDGQRHSIRNGMTVTANLKVRTQRPIDAILGPVVGAFDKAFHQGR